MLSKCGIYRVIDPIDNFKIRVRLEKGSSDGTKTLYSALTTSVNNQPASNELELRELGGSSQNNSNRDFEEYVFSWQEKVFSQREIEKYANIHEDDASELEKKYHRQVEELRRREGSPTERLFSYVDVDHPPMKREEEQAPLRTDSCVLRRRKNGLKAAADRRLVKSPMSDKIVNYNISEEECKEGHTLAAPLQVMYIMAAVGYQSGTQENEEDHEVILCTITFNINDTLIVKPDFNFGQVPYRLEIGNLGREVYHYTLENASVSISSEEKEREARILQDFNLRRCTLLTNQIGFEFPEPPKGILRLYIFGEIESVEDFEHDNLYINMFVELPKDWTTEGDEPLYKVTQTCSTKYVGNNDIAYFSFPFEYHLSCPLKSITDESSANIPRWPQICFQIMSRDSWNRYRTEGYGYLTVSSIPGSQKLQIETWRPVVGDLKSHLRRYFIGGSPELEDISLAGNVPIVKGKRISKYGMQTVSSGRMTVRLQTVQQCQEFSSLSYQNTLGRLTDGLRSTCTLEASVETVLEAFHRARHRMLVARDHKGLLE